MENEVPPHLYQQAGGVASECDLRRDPHAIARARRFAIRPSVQSTPTEGAPAMALYAVPTEPVELTRGADVLAEVAALIEARLPGVATDDPCYDSLHRLLGPLQSRIEIEKYL